MAFLLDTNVCIGILNGKEPDLRAKIASLSRGDLVVCSVVRAELWYGALKSQQRTENEARVQVFLQELETAPFDDESAAVYADLRATLEQQGISLGAYDLMIAAIAIERGATLVSRDSAFAQIPGLKLERW